MTYLIKIVVRLVATNMSRKERRKGRVDTWKRANDTQWSYMGGQVGGIPNLAPNLIVLVTATPHLTPI